METSVQEALKIGLVNNQIHTLVISGGTGVGKSYVLRQCLDDLIVYKAYFEGLLYRCFHS